MYTVLRKLSLLSAVAGTLALGGCATEEEVQHAQATADQALSAAQQAQSTASAAQGAAATAQQGVDQLRGEVNSLTTRVDGLEQKHRGERG